MIASILALALASTPALPQSTPQGRRVGQVFPDIELPTIDGSKTVRLSELRGQRVLLIEFASW